MKKNILFLVFIISIALIRCTKETDPTHIESVYASIEASLSLASEPATNGEFTITLSKSISSSVDISFTISGTATNGTDYEIIQNKITILANRTIATIPIKIINDTTIEGDETIIITLTTTNNENVLIGSSKTATINISDKPDVFVLTPSDARSYMVNPNATNETAALFYNLKILSKTKIIVGQEDAFNSFYNNANGDSDIKKNTGNDPGLLGSDFMFIADDKNDGTASNWWFQQEQKIKTDVINAYNKGMVNTFCWHFREPYEGLTFYTSEMTTTQKANAFKSILPDGENHTYYKQKLDKIAQVTKSLVGNDGKLVPIIFRPFHEFDGDWFWWGKSFCTPSEYITLWQFTVQYLKDTKGVNNMLFAFSPDKNFTTKEEYLSRYPGDAYVDILGMDNYGDFDKGQGITGVNKANEKLQILTKLAIEKVKIAALTETGYRVEPGVNTPIAGFHATNMYNALTNNNVEIAYMMYWNNTNTAYYTPPSGVTDTNDFILYANKERTVLQNTLPNMYLFN